MNIKNIFCVYNDVKTQHKLFKIFGKTVLDIKRKFSLRGRRLVFEIPNHIEGRYIHNASEGNDLISNIIKAGNPAMVARFGGSEMNIVKYFYDRKDSVLRINYPEKIIKEAINQPGIFNADTDTLIRFSSEMLEYISDVDVLAVWNCFRSPEYYCSKAGMLKEFAGKNLKLTTAEPILNGMFADNTWTQYLKNKKVLVISPFVDTIKKQYENKRKDIFPDKNILPEFELKLIKAPQGIGKNNLKEEFGTWFKALESMQNQMDKTDFDICLSGAGAYGYHLAHYAKKLGKIGIHVAGALQLLFGIKGSRWLNDPFVKNLMNDNWVFPSESERPVDNKEFIKGEGSNAYW